MKVVIYTDGGADPNPGVGGWAAILQADGQEKVLTGHDPWTTNNRMELQAAIAALQALRRPAEVEFYTDSEYLRQGITGWIEKWAARSWVHKDGRPVANADLWRQLWPLTKQHTIYWHWVRGHTGDSLNERVDQLARQARLEITPAPGVAVGAPRLYVRSSCRGNPGPGGWGAVLEQDGETVQTSGSDPRTTNNRMELTAVIEGLRLLPSGSAVQVFTTSDYVYQGATRWIHGWRQREWKKPDGQPVSNQDLWQMLDQLMGLYTISWVNAKGEAGQETLALHEAATLASTATDSLA